MLEKLVPDTLHALHARDLAPSALDFTQISNAIRRYKRLIIALSLMGMGLAAGYLTVATPHYTATTMILIDPHKNELLQGQQVAVDPQLDAGSVESQVEIMKSEQVARTVVRDLNLVNDAEFNGSRRSLIGRLLAVFRVNRDFPVVDDPERGAMKIVSSNVTAKRLSLSYVIQVDYTSTSQDTAARIANGIAQAYLDEEMNARLEFTTQAARWFESRIVNLKHQAIQSDTAVQLFKAKNNIVETSRGLMSEQQLSDLNSQLVQARAAADETKARVDRIQQVVQNDAVPGASVSDALHDDVINRLRAQYLDLVAREHDFSVHYGQDHAVVLALRDQINEIRKSIADEMNRIAETYKSDYAIAKSRSDSIERSLGQLVSQAGEDSAARVKLRDLESLDEANHALYNSYLQKLVQASQQQTAQASEARVITPATPPAGKSSPNGPLTISAGLSMGLLIGFGIAFGRELSGRTFRTEAEIYEATGVPCLGILPNMSTQRLRTIADLFEHVSGKAIVEEKNVESGANDFEQSNSRTQSDHLSKLTSIIDDAPFSRYAETIRNVKVSVDMTRQLRELKVIGVVSSLPQEGKSTTAFNLAHLIAGSGCRTLLIDADLRNPGLTKRMSRQFSAGLIGLIEENGQLIDFVEPVRGSLLDFLPCSAAVRVHNGAEILASAHMAQVIRQARESYEYVVLDFAPLNPVVDVKACSHLVDGFLYVVEWDKTSKQALRTALHSHGHLANRILGIVLNRADPKTLRHYEHFYGARYHTYYPESSRRRS